jgi:hypothetical protein
LVTHPAKWLTDKGGRSFSLATYLNIVQNLRGSGVLSPLRHRYLSRGTVPVGTGTKVSAGCVPVMAAGVQRSQAIPFSLCPEAAGAGTSHSH